MLKDRYECRTLILDAFRKQNHIRGPRHFFPMIFKASIIVALIAIVISIWFFLNPRQQKYLVVGNSQSFKTSSVLKLMNSTLSTIKSSKNMFYEDFVIYCGSKRKSLEFQNFKGGKIIVFQRDEDFELLRQVEMDSRPKLVVFDSEFVKSKFGKSRCKSVVQKLDQVDLNALKQMF